MRAPLGHQPTVGSAQELGAFGEPGVFCEREPPGPAERAGGRVDGLQVLALVRRYACTGKAARLLVFGEQAAEQGRPAAVHPRR